MLFNQHPLASPGAAPPIESMGCVPQCGKEKSPRPPAGQRTNEFTVKVNWRSPRGVDHFHPANMVVAAPNESHSMGSRAANHVKANGTYILAIRGSTPSFIIANLMGSPQ